MSNELESLTPTEETNESHALRVIGWFSIGMAVATLGIYVGFELRNRYKFKRRTPYDFYSNASEHQEYGVGV